MAVPNVECMIDDDCHTEMDVCDREQICKQAELPSDAVCAKGFNCRKEEMCINDRCRPIWEDLRQSISVGSFFTMIKSSYLGSSRLKT